MTSVKNSEIESRTKTHEQYIETLEALRELEAGLSTWDRKIIDKNFFKRFEEKREGYTYHKYSLYKSTRSWGAPYSIHLKHNNRLELDSRETAHVREMIKKDIERYTLWDEQNAKRIESLESTDEDALRRDLLAVWEKHNRPEIWRQTLDSYEVKYPKED